MTSDKLRECPFCGGEEVRFIPAVYSYGEQLSDDRVECQNCEATIHDINARKSWNTRAADEKVRVLVEAANKLLKYDGGVGSECFHAVHFYDARVDLRIALAQLEGEAK